MSRTLYSRGCRASYTFHRPTDLYLMANAWAGCPRRAAPRIRFPRHALATDLSQGALRVGVRHDLLTAIVGEAEKMRSGASIVTGLAGAVFALTVSATDPQPIVHMGTKPSELITAKITVANLRTSIDFYTKVVGLKQIKLPRPAQNIDDPDASIEICLNFSSSLADPFLCLLKQKGMVLDREQAKLIWVSFKIPDVRAVVNRARAAGFKVEGDVEPFMGLLLGHVADPDGYTLELIQASSVTK